MNSKKNPKKSNKKRSQQQSHNARSTPRPVAAQNKPSTAAPKVVPSAPLVSMAEAVPSTPPVPAPASEATGAQNTPLPPATEEALSGPPSTQVAGEPPTVQASAPEKSGPVCGFMGYWFTNALMPCLVLGGSLFAVLMAFKFSTTHKAAIDFFLEQVLGEQLAFTTGIYLLFPLLFTYSVVVFIWGGVLSPTHLKTQEQIKAYSVLVKPFLQLCSGIYALASMVALIVFLASSMDRQLFAAIAAFLLFSAILSLPLYYQDACTVQATPKKSNRITVCIYRALGLLCVAASVFFAACYVLHLYPADQAVTAHKAAVDKAKANNQQPPKFQENSHWNPCYCYRLIF